MSKVYPKCDINSTHNEKFPISPFHKRIKQLNFSNISWYQLLFAGVFCLIDFEAQGQTFEHSIIDLRQPLDNIQLNMHNMYVTLSCLCSFDGLIILQNITIQNIHKVNFKKGSLEMTTPVLKSNINQINIPTQYHKLIEGKKNM